MNVYEIIMIFILHWIGDFLLQTQEMATKKSTSIIFLTLHAMVYGAVLTLGGLVFLVWTAGFSILWWATVNMILHWITDKYTSKWTSRLYKEQKFYGFPSFFSVIGLDQMVHGIVLFSTYVWLN